MKEIIITILVNAILIFFLPRLIKGIEVKNFAVSLVVAILLATVNTFVKPLVVLLTIPVTILTLGLFLLVVNALMILLVSAVVQDFKVKGFWAALGMWLCLWVVNLLLGLSLNFNG